MARSCSGSSVCSISSRSAGGTPTQPRPSSSNSAERHAIHSVPASSSPFSSTALIEGDELDLAARRDVVFDEEHRQPPLSGQRDHLRTGSAGGSRRADRARRGRPLPGGARLLVILSSRWARTLLPNRGPRHQPCADAGAPAPTPDEAHTRPVLAGCTRAGAGPHQTADQNDDRRCRRCQRPHRRHGGDGAPGDVRRLEGADTRPGPDDDPPPRPRRPRPTDHRPRPLTHRRVGRHRAGGGSRPRPSGRRPRPSRPPRPRPGRW